MQRMNTIGDDSRRLESKQSRNNNKQIDNIFSTTIASNCKLFYYSNIKQNFKK